MQFFSVLSSPLGLGGAIQIHCCNANVLLTYYAIHVCVQCNKAHRCNANAAMQMLVDETRNQFGKIDILVCNAATNPFFGSLLDIPEEAFDKVMNNNIKSNHLLCNMVLPEMIERKDGREIIEVSFLKGDAIKIISGPFVDFNGVVEEINEDKQKVKVIVSIFGRPTPVELDFFQVEMYK